jgi:hypothetical protein
MFTHGICIASVDGQMRFNKFMFRADQMGEPTEDNLAERVQKAATILRYMGEELARHNPRNPKVQRFVHASEMLLQEQRHLVGSMRASYQTETGAF